MISFHVPLTKKEEGGEAKEFFSFAIKSKSTVLFAGSRNQELSFQVCNDIIYGFGRLGFSFILGCANGVDASFRSALAESDHRHRSLVACCYPYRLDKITDLPVKKLVVPDSVHPRSAPRVRTLYMVDRCDMALVFADDPKTDSWGKGSTIVINNCIKQSKPVFIITKHRPDKINDYHVLPTCLFGVVKGYFIIPKRAGIITRSHSLKKKEVASWKN